ncbi:MAG TPA: hypothetical protein PLD59_15935 [Tepidisphaeraceae bacterium]|nr:hypothetical protein [Tepidisphaeraceae bacterium]
MSNAVFLQHAPHLSPGRFIPIFRDFGIPCEVRHVYKGDEIPTDLESIRILVSLGGPMRVADVGSDKHPYLANEVALLKRLVDADRPVLGIALGAQLLAHAAGAKVYPNVAGPEGAASPAPEFGWAPVTFPFPGGTEPMVYGMMDGAPMFHWHHDTFDLPKLPPPANLPPNAPAPPPGNALLSSSRLCKVQAFRFKTQLFGFQYHFEMTRPDIEAMLSADGAAAQQALGGEGVAQIRADTEKHYPRYARLGDKLVQNVVQFLKQY